MKQENRTKLAKIMRDMKIIENVSKGFGQKFASVSVVDIKQIGDTIQNILNNEELGESK